MALPPDQMMKAAGEAEHIFGAVSGLLERRTITDAAVASALDGAKGSKRFSDEAVDRFASSLPPASDQAKLRAALEAGAARSATFLLELHSDAHARGMDLAGMMSSNQSSDAP